MVTPHRPHRHIRQRGHGHERSHEHGHERDAVGGIRLTRWRHTLGHLVRPHGHGVADSVDAALETSAEGIRAVRLSLLVLAATFVLQLTVVVWSGSAALLADSVHNLADALTAVPLWVAFTLARRPASRRYTYGYGRAEDLAGVFVVLVIVLSVVLAAYESAQRLLHHRPVEHLTWVAVAGLIGFAGNELVAVHRIRVGRRIGSAALVADGVHARADGLTSLAVVLGAAGTAAGFPLADPVAGLLITLVILGVLHGAAVEVYRRLMDAVDPALVDTAEAVLRAVPGVLDVGRLRLRWIGHRLRAEAEIVVDHRASVVAAHQVAVAAEHALISAIPGLTGALVHADPWPHASEPHEPLTHHATRR